MKFFSKFRTMAVLTAALMTVGTWAEAQSIGLSVTAPDAILVSNSFAYIIVVTNQTGVSQTFIVTNTLTGAPFQFSSTPTASQGSNTISGSNVIFFLLTIATSNTATMNLPVTATSIGYITNTVTVNIVSVTNFSGSITTHVTNAVPPTQADLAVAMSGPAVVFTNDWVNYAVNVTNLGPNSASNVMLTNTLPPGVGYKTNSLAFTRQGSGSNVIFNLGTLASNAFINLHLTVQPTNAGDSLSFSSFVNSTNVIDPNTNNNTASLNITVTNYFAGQLTVVTNSRQIYNPQNGLVEQSILLSNTGTNAVAAARVVVTGLSNQLFNAWSTNNGNPFVVYAANLNTNQSVNLLLQYVAGAYFPLTNSQLHAFAVSVPNLTPPSVAAVGTNLSIARIVRLATNQDLLIEFPSLTNRTYTVVYSDNVSFSNAMTAMPSIVAPANRTQWIDYGPPTTVSHPTNAPDRFYRVFLNP